MSEGCEVVKRQAKARLAIDIGGTFTDVVLKDGRSSIWTRKVATSQDDYARAILGAVAEILAEAHVAPSEVKEVIHATTIATNAILEHHGPPTGLLTTSGFRDILEIARIRTPSLFDLDWVKPTPLVPRRFRLEVDERISAQGAIIRPLDPGSVRRAASILRDAGVQGVAICFLNSYVEPAHERAAAAILHDEFPDFSVSVSSEVLPEIKEYERTSTTVINAFLAPVVLGYLSSLQLRLHDIGIDAPLHVMRSDGGTIAASLAAERPIFIVGSGPAAGVIATHRLANRRSIANVISFDMGGTTAKASVIEDGRFARTSEYEVRAGITTPSRFIKAGGYLLMVPAIDLAEVGNGAGSIARVDSGGALLVGPESAGATPGPACYGLGGQDATITDANVVLGYLNPERLAGGAVSIHRPLAEQAIADRVARPLGLGLSEAAHGIHLVANSNMLRATRAVTTERGRDPRRFVLCAFGGSGPVHAAEIAAQLEIALVIVPPLAGLYSSVGLLFSRVEHAYGRTRLQPTRVLTVKAMGEALDELEQQAWQGMRQEGYHDGQVELERLADLRYIGQAATLSVPVPVAHSDAELRQSLETDFAAEHARTYGHSSDEEQTELVNLRVIARAPLPEWVPSRGRPSSGGTTGTATRRAYFGPRVGHVDTPIVARDALASSPTPGPLIIEEYDSTIVVPPGARVSVDDEANLLIEIGSL